MSHSTGPVRVPQMSHVSAPRRVPQCVSSGSPTDVPQRAPRESPTDVPWHVPRESPTVCAQWESHRCPNACAQESPQMSHSIRREGESYRCPTRVPRKSPTDVPVCPARVHRCPTVCAPWESTDVPQCPDGEAALLCCSLFDMCSLVFLNRSLSIFLSVLAYMFTLRALFLSIAIFPHIPRQHLYLKWHQQQRALNWHCGGQNGIYASTGQCISELPEVGMVPGISVDWWLDETGDRKVVSSRSRVQRARISRHYLNWLHPRLPMHSLAIFWVNLFPPSIKIFINYLICVSHNTKF